MCTLIAHSRIWDDAPLVIAANRDERLDRPAAPPRETRVEGRRVLAPVDLQAGGTWLGLNDRGLFVGITNRFGRAPDPTRASRGHLVTRALAAGSAREAFEQLIDVRATTYNGFHLMLADRQSAFLIRNDGDRVVRDELAPGTHIVTERSFDAAPTQRLARLDALIAPLRTEPPRPARPAWQRLLATHAEEGLEGVCVHAPALGYGTRSSTWIVLGASPADVTFWYADGPPCTTPMQPVPMPHDWTSSSDSRGA